MPNDFRELTISNGYNPMSKTSRMIDKLPIGWAVLEFGYLEDSYVYTHRKSKTVGGSQMRKTGTPKELVEWIRLSGWEPDEFDYVPYAVIVHEDVYKFNGVNWTKDK